MALLRKLYGLRGLEFGRRVAGVGTAAAFSLAAGATLCLAGGPAPARALLVGAGCVGAAAALALLYVPVGEVLFRCGMTHAPQLLKYGAAPLTLAGGLGGAATAWLGLGPGADRRGPATVVLPLLVPLALACVFAALVTLYASLVAAHRRRQIGDWKERLARPAGAPPGALDRVAAFLAMEEADRPAFSVHGPAFPGVTTKAFHDDLRRPEWMDLLEANFETVRREVMRVVDDQAAFAAEEKGWFRFNKKFKMFKFFQRGWSAENCARCPETAAILSRVATNGDIVVALLHPGGRLRNHIDFAAPTLVYHLGIKVPPRCGIRVGADTRTWTEGKGIVFDNTFEHEVWNDSDEVRVILLVDFCHPELTPSERRFFSTTSPDEPGDAPAAVAEHLAAE